MNFYFDTGILQVPQFTGCQVYTYNILSHLIPLAPSDTFHLHFAMGGWNNHIDPLLQFPNVVCHRQDGAVGRHVTVPLNILRTGSKTHYIMNGNTGKLRVPVPCKTLVLFHDMRNILCRDIYGEEFCAGFRRSAESWIYARDCIVTGTETVKQEIIDEFKIPAERIVVASESTEHITTDGETHPVRPEKLPENRPYFLMVNPSDIRKNCQDTLNGFSLYLRQNPNDTETLLVFAGLLRANDGWVNERLQQEPALAERTVLLGYVSDAELKYLYQNARMMVYPSRYEGFGIPVLEAMGQNIPVIVSDIPVFREVAENAAVFVPLDQPETMAEAMTQVNRDDTLRRTLIQNGQGRVRFYSWERSAKITLDTLRDLAG
jgi:glycosyltransferase involved in cell wall biosynthesis